MEHIDNIIKNLKLDVLDSNQSLVFVKEKTGMPPSRIAFGIIVLVALVLIVLQASTLLICIGCFLLPAYYSFLGLQSHDHAKYVKYLTYWVVFSITEVSSFLFQWILGPTMWAIGRVALTAALLHPQLQLSQKIYYKLIEPYVMRYQRTIDKTAQDLVNKGKQKMDQLAQKGQKVLQQAINKKDQ